MSKITTHLSKDQVAYWEERYIKGNVTNDEWSQMTPALRKHLVSYKKRYLKEVKKSAK